MTFAKKQLAVQINSKREHGADHREACIRYGLSLHSDIHTNRLPASMFAVVITENNMNTVAVSLQFTCGGDHDHMSAAFAFISLFCNATQFPKKSAHYFGCLIVCGLFCHIDRFKIVFTLATLLLWSLLKYVQNLLTNQSYWNKQGCP